MEAKGRRRPFGWHCRSAVLLRDGYSYGDTVVAHDSREILQGTWRLYDDPLGIAVQVAVRRLARNCRQSPNVLCPCWNTTNQSTTLSGGTSCRISLANIRLEG